MKCPLSCQHAVASRIKIEGWANLWFVRLANCCGRNGRNSSCKVCGLAQGTAPWCQSPKKHRPVFRTGRTVTVGIPSRTCPNTQSSPIFVAASMASTSNPVGVLSRDTSMFPAVTPAASSAFAISWPPGLGLLLVNWSSWSLTAAASWTVSGARSAVLIPLVGAGSGELTPTCPENWEQPTSPTTVIRVAAAIEERPARGFSAGRPATGRCFEVTSSFCHWSRPPSHASRWDPRGTSLCGSTKES